MMHCSGYLLIPPNTHTHLSRRLFTEARRFSIVLAAERDGHRCDRGSMANAVTARREWRCRGNAKRSPRLSELVNEFADAERLSAGMRSADGDTHSGEILLLATRDAISTTIKLLIAHCSFPIQLMNPIVHYQVHSIAGYGNVFARASIRRIVSEIMNLLRRSCLFLFTLQPIECANFNTFIFVE